MLYANKIKCPRHFMKKPGKTGWVMEIDPLLRKFNAETLKKFKINPLRRKKDRNGQWIRNDLDYYQAPISGAMAIEHIWDPMNPICIKCKNRCWEGKGLPRSYGIKRLHGKGMKNQDLKRQGVIGV